MIFYAIKQTFEHFLCPVVLIFHCSILFSALLIILAVLDQFLKLRLVVLVSGHQGVLFLCQIVQLFENLFAIRQVGITLLNCRGGHLVNGKSTAVFLSESLVFRMRLVVLVELTVGVHGVRFFHILRECIHLRLKFPDFILKGLALISGLRK